MQVCESGVIYDGVGLCIYCGDMQSALSREHIIPFGLNGDLVLPKSSCDNCRGITGKFEGHVLKKMLLYPRARWGLKSQKKTLPTTFPLTITRQNGRKRHKQVPLDELPTHLNFMPRFTLPGIILQRPAWELPAANLKPTLSAQDAQILLSHGDGTESVQTPAIQMVTEDFMRMLAKIGHAYAVAQLGLKFKPILQDLIVSGSQSLRYYIGSEETDPPAEDYLFQIKIGDFGLPGLPRFLCVGIRLFSFLATPWYVVAVGKSGSYDISRLKNGGYNKPIKISVVDR